MSKYSGSKSIKVLDALYGPIAFGEELSMLMRAPVVQRMRHIRLSNIDSIAMPGVAGLSRFEHVLGTAYLSTIVGCSRSLDQNERLALHAASLLHDWAITAFGHLVEEAFAYIGSTFNHEGKLVDLVASPTAADIGGVSRQVLCGRETGIYDWCTQVFGGEADKYLNLITETIAGRGALGPVVAGEIDLDNIDNLHRIAFHMGLSIDREAPIRLSRSLLGATSSGNPIFSSEAKRDLLSWVELRRNVYTHLMLAQPDFTAKLMLLYATIHAMRAGEFTDQDWNMTDVDYVSRLSQSKVKESKETTERWMAGEYWEMAPLFWLEGPVPRYSQVAAFSEALSEKMDRTVFAYRIKDKRERRLHVQFDSNTIESFGIKSANWLLGIGSPARAPFTKDDVLTMREFSSIYFNSQLIADPVVGDAEGAFQGSLI